MLIIINPFFPLFEILKKKIIVIQSNSLNNFFITKHFMDYHANISYYYKYIISKSMLQSIFKIISHKK